MKKPDWKKLEIFLNSAKGKKVLLLSLLAAVVFFVVLVSLRNQIDSFIPGKDKLAKAKSDNLKARNDYNDILVKYQSTLAADRRYAELRKNAWKISTDGDIDTGLRNAVEQAALNSGLRPNSIGNVRKNSINSELSFAEIDINITDTLENLVVFWQAIYNNPVELSWKRVDLRPERRFRQQSSNSINRQLVFSGTVKVIVDEDKKGGEDK